MSLEMQEGVVDRLTEKGVVVGGTWFGFSKHLKGPCLTEAHLGHKVTVLFHTYMERPYIDVVKAIGEKVPGWKPPESPKNGSWGGQGRRLSPEELTLKREEGVRIARSVAVDRAISLLKEGIAVEKIGPLAQVIEGYLLSGKFPEAGKAMEQDRPSAAPKPLPAKEPAPSPAGAKARSSSAVSRTKRPDPKAVNALFNDAKRAGLLAEWSTYIALCRSLLRNDVESPYSLSAAQFAEVEADLRTRFSRGTAA
jgi:hypothetical protein